MDPKFPGYRKIPPAFLPDEPVNIRVTQHPADRFPMEVTPEVRTAREAVANGVFERQAVGLRSTPCSDDSRELRDVRRMAKTLDERIATAHKQEIENAVDAMPVPTAAPEKAALKPSPDHTGSLRGRYVWVAQSDLVTDLATDLTLTPSALCRRYDGIQPKDTSIQSYLFAGANAIPKVDAYGYYPGAPQIVQEGGARYLNRWHQRSFEPIAGDVTPFVDHLRYLLDEVDELVNFYLDWLAHLVQFPAIKQSTALLMTSREEGIGKGIAARMFAEVVGLTNTRYLSAEALGSDFNDWLATATLIVVEEYQDIGRRGGPERLKSYITDEIADINPKHAPRYRARNVAHFLLFANDSAPLRLTEHDRRFVVYRSQASPKAEVYYRDLMGWFMNRGRQHVLANLLVRDLSDYRPKGRAPITAAHQDLVVDSRDPVVAYLHHALEAQEPPFANQLVVVKHVVDHVNSVGRVRLTTRIVEDFLRDVNAIRLPRQYRLISGHDGRSNVWVVGNLADWQGDVPVERVRANYVHPDEQAGRLLALAAHSANQPAAVLQLAEQPRRRQIGESF